MDFSQFGSGNGRLVFYFHGAPGAPQECSTFDLQGKKHGLTFICLNRFGVDSSVSGETYYQLLAAEILRISSGHKVDIVGFSIGAFIALQTSRYLGDRVGSLHLVSAAAPLETGNFLDTMAARQVFRLAAYSPALFTLLAHFQGFLARVSPNALFHLLFASATGEDRMLAADQEFRAHITKVLRACFIGHVRGYARDVGLYVRPWEKTLATVSVDTYIWHGAADNWSPPLMAEYLESAIPGCKSRELISRLSHYSCLNAAAPKICKLLADA